MARLSQEQRERYIQQGGPSCPFCGDLNIEGQNCEFDVGIMWQEVKCLACGETWTDDYTLTGITYDEAKGGD